MKIELYIDKQLCDISDPDKFSVYLKRQLYNPTELNTKDAQASYTITLPASTTNNRIFGFANVEEVRGKFERLYDAELIVNGVRIFEGNFKLSEIDSYSYKGNLGIPAPKTAKDIFGDKVMNKMGEWKLDLSKYEGLNFISEINKQENPPCIFPFVLYGLLPKVLEMETDADKDIEDDTPEEEINYINEYKNKFKNIYDQTVRLGIEDFPPSVNCLQMLEKIFDNAGYKLTGSAFSDERLKHLYVSYKNPNDYVQEWNWGDLGKMSVHAQWSTHDNSGEETKYEKQITKSTDCYAINLFNSNRLKPLKIDDKGTNIIYSKYPETYTLKEKPITDNRHSIHMIIPRSGYYKVKLKCDKFQLYTEPDNGAKYEDTISGIRFVGVNQNNGVDNSFNRSRYEIQVLRDYAEGDFRLSDLAGLFNSPQFPQTKQDDSSQFPKFHPASGDPMVIDPSVNQNFICGLHWGQHSDQYETYGPGAYAGNYMFIANGFSWDKTFSQKNKILCAYDSSIYDIYNNRNESGNYHYYGKIFPEATEEGQEESKNPEWKTGLLKKRYGYFKEEPDFSSSASKYNHIRQTVSKDIINYRFTECSGKGYVECTIWLEKGERITAGVVGDLGDQKGSGNGIYDDSVVMTDMEFILEIEPFRTDIEWCNFDSLGNYNPKNVLSWNDTGDYGFQQGFINLIDFLPSGQKANDWIDNFCKAFNLSLLHTESDKFELNVKYKELISHTSNLIDLDKRAHTVNRNNASLGLPEKYKLGFSANADEEGYFESMQEDGRGNKITSTAYSGGGEFITGSHDTGTTEQTSNFSYCWYKQLYTPNESKESIPHFILVPVISDHEVWKITGKGDYQDMMSKTYFDKTQRFWYHSGNTVEIKLGDTRNDPDASTGKIVDIAITSNKQTGNAPISLNYEDEPGSIMRHYFFLLNNNSNYTEVECYLTPQEYAKVNVSLAKFNGDLYNITSVDGYDPGCHKPAKLKLIPKINK